MSNSKLGTWLLNRETMEVTVGDTGMTFATTKATTEVGWRHIVSADYLTMSGFKGGRLVAGITLLVVGILFTLVMLREPAIALMFILLIVAGVALIATTFGRKKFCALIRDVTGRQFKLFGEAEQLQQFLSAIRKQIWGK